MYRTKEGIRRLHENKKKELREKAADAKMEQKKTGGGLPPPGHDEPFVDLLLSITNKKTISGLETSYAGDISSDEEAESNSDVEIVYEYAPEDDGRSEGFNKDENVEEDSFNPLVVANTWKKYSATDLQKPISPALRPENLKENNEFAKNRFDGTNKKKDPAGTSTGNTGEKNLCDPKSVEKKDSIPAANRRRPTTQVKALTSSEVSEKYNQLLDKRLEVADFTKKRLSQEINQLEEKHKKEMEVLDIQLLNEKERLKKLKRNDY